MSNDLFPLVMGVFSTNIGLVLCLLGKILPLYRVAFDLERNRVGTPLYEFCDLTECVFLFQKAPDLPPVAFRELPPGFVFLS